MSTLAARAKKVRENVLTLLEEIPETRNDDKLLMVNYWQRFDEITFDENFATAFVSAATSPESIHRARRSIQSGGLFTPTDEEVLKNRRMLAEEARQYYAQN